MNVSSNRVFTIPFNPIVHGPSLMRPPNALSQSLLQFVVSCKGKDSTSSIFASVLETRGTHEPNLVFNALMNAYTDSGFISNAIQCFRLVRKHGFRILFHSCGYLLDRLMKSNSPAAAWAFYSEIFECGFPPNIYTFNILMHTLCREGKIKEAGLIFYEISKKD
uniref:Pentatricopeptide repeat-containing protein n=1 Tax=Nelumbo nucifera TaxID=4432 RepID=A0A822Z2Q4_NELNU|nr:TPA_asm: hypothetical protein HUJ06_006418 [Nelumbo nucifera]